MKLILLLLLAGGLGACGTGGSVDRTTLLRHGTSFTVHRDSVDDVWMRGLRWMDQHGAAVRTAGSTTSEGDRSRTCERWSIERLAYRDSVTINVTGRPLPGCQVAQDEMAMNLMQLSYYMHYGQKP